MSTVTGIHHVTCIAGDPQENVDFYTGSLGMRLVKKSVNQDVPDTYHLFYADGEAHPGADLTFFPWPKLPPVQKGVGLAVEVSLAIPKGSLEYWEDRLASAGANLGGREVRHGEHAVRLTDPHGLELALVETADEREFAAWSQSPVPASHQIRGLHAVRLWERDITETASFLIETLGFAMVGEENGWRRYAINGGGSGRHLDIRAVPNEQHGCGGRAGFIMSRGACPTTPRSSRCGNASRPHGAAPQKSSTGSGSSPSTSSNPAGSCSRSRRTGRASRSMKTSRHLASTSCCPRGSNSTDGRSRTRCPRWRFASRGCSLLA